MVRGGELSGLLGRLNAELGGSYRLTGEVGAGGMATVFAAQDLRHGREVAVKVLRSELAATIGTDRFLAEIRTTARLQHPNILPLFDSGEAAGHLYFVMPLVEGPSLFTLLRQRGRLPVEEAVEIVCTLAEALDHAHRHGVLHRDIKPENVLMSDGVPVLLDFGLALALEGPGGARLTEAGRGLGTVAFMSPEQAMGKTDLDHRSDIYSLACVLYEALCGEPPHSADSAQAVLTRRLVEPPTPIRSLRPTIPVHVAAALERALATDPGDRFGSVLEFAAALRRAAAESRARQVIVVRAEPRSFGVLMHEGDDETLTQARRRARELVEQAFDSGGGALNPSPGYSLIATFGDIQASLDSVSAARQAIAQFNAERSPTEHIHYRFGVAGGSEEGGVATEGASLEQAGELAWAAGTDGVSLSANLQEQVGPAEPPPGPVPGTPRSLPPQLESFEIPPPARPSIAIMPFASAEGDAEAQAIAEGLRIDITNALMKIDRIFLTAPSVMNHFRGADGPETAKRMGTRHALEGTVRRSGGRVRVGMQLTDTSAGQLVWTERYDRVLDDAFELQDEIAARVITELDVKLTMGEQARVWRKCLTHPEARRHYYRGLSHFFESTRDSVLSARSEFERVARLVPDSPVGPTWTALSLWLQAIHDWDPEAPSLAVEWARRAAAFPDADGQAHTVLGATLLLERRWDEAIATARDSVRIRPGCNTANGVLASVLLHCGEYQEAIVHSKRSIRIGPVYPPLFLETLGAAYREAGHLDLAITVCREISRIAPESVSGRLVLASALVRGGWVSEAQHAVRGVPQLEPEFKLDRYLAAQPFRSKAVTDRLRVELAEAGLS